MSDEVRSYKQMVKPIKTQGMQNYKLPIKNTQNCKYCRSSIQKGMFGCGKQVNTVNITSFTCNSIHSVIIVKLKTSSSQNDVIIPYKADTGNDGNVMPYYILNFLFLRASKGQLVAKNIEMSY